MDPAGGTESIRLSPGLVCDVGIQADLLCEHRPHLAADGFERIGVFVRDRAAGAFDGTLSQQGACYALTWDGHDGRIRCLRVQGGTSTDLLPVPRFALGTGWRRFRIEAAGSELAFVLDGQRLLQVTDAAHGSGEFGIGYREFFTTNANMRGARVDSFHADVPGSFALSIVPGPAPGELHLRRRRGIPGDLYFTALTIVPGAFPNGWFFGLDPLVSDLDAFLASGNPAFVGWLDAAGEHDFGAFGLPPGVPLQGVALDVDPTLSWLQASVPVAVTTR
jgi:hypothetical protein